MQDTNEFQRRVAGLEALLQEKLGVRGRSLSQRLKRAGRRLPKRLRKSGELIAQAQARADHPRLARLQDPQALDTAFADLKSFLKTIDPADRRKGAILGVLGSIVFNLLIFGTVLIALLKWQNVI